MTETMLTEIGPLAESLSGNGVFVPTSRLRVGNRANAPRSHDHSEAP
jgi:hypothetical protein